MTTNQKGLIAETAIMHELVKLEIAILRPLSDQPYDLMLDLGGEVMRVQGKWAVRRGDVVVVPCRRCRRGPDGFFHGRYAADEIDAIAAYCADLGRCYLLPLALSVNRTATQLRLSPTATTNDKASTGPRTSSWRLHSEELSGP
jgi:hypothetical protein